MSNNEIEPKNFLPPADMELNTDFVYTRNNLYILIQTAMIGLEEFAPVCQQMQNARSYEVLFNAIKTAAELNEKLTEHSLKKEESTREEKSVSEKGDTIHNTLITTADLAEIVEKALKKDEK